MTNIRFKKILRTCPRTCQRYGQGQVTDTNNNDNNIYLFLFNKYKKRIKEQPKRTIQIISELKKSSDYELLTIEEQDKLFMELMNPEKRSE